MALDDYHIDPLKRAEFIQSLAKNELRHPHTMLKFAEEKGARIMAGLAKYLMRLMAKFPYETQQEIFRKATSESQKRADCEVKARADKRVAFEAQCAEQYGDSVTADLERQMQNNGQLDTHNPGWSADQRRNQKAYAKYDPTLAEPEFI